MLNICQPVLGNHIARCNKSERRVKPIKQAFVKADSTPLKVKRVEETTSLLQGANDWKLLIDYDHKRIVFPPTICPTSQRPDIIIWAERSKVIIWAEVTCPAEENIRSAQTRKNRRYADLADLRKKRWMDASRPHSRSWCPRLCCGHFPPLSQKNWSPFKRDP